MLGNSDGVSHFYVHEDAELLGERARKVVARPGDRVFQSE